MASVIEREEFSQAKNAQDRPEETEVFETIMDWLENPIDGAKSRVDETNRGIEASKSAVGELESAVDAVKESAADGDVYDPAEVIGWSEMFGDPPPWGKSDPERYALDDPKQRFVAFRDFFLGVLLPIRAGDLELTWVPPEVAEQNSGLVMEWESAFADIPKVTMRIIRWQTNKETGTVEISDLIEQEMYTPVKEIDSFARFRALFEGWALVLHEFFVWEAKQKAPSYVYPVDCFSGMVIDAYDLKKAQTREDFYAAMKAKRRLGRLFGV